jgi:hypothetical protein
MPWLCPIIWEMLKRIDYELAIKTKIEGCLRCKGKLDWASFPRKPRGIESLQSERRMSFCCRKCRKRVTPRSVRFLWKKVYVLLAVALEPEVGMIGVCRRTINRWRAWWPEHLSEGSLFCAHFRYLLPIEFAFDLRTMIESFSETVGHNFMILARFLSPLGCAPSLRF